MTAPFVITGSSSGIGHALYGLMSANGHEVIGIDRKAGPACDIVCDLADPGNVVDAAARISTPIGGIAHVAGVPGTAAAPTVLAVNLLAPRQLTALLADRLVEHGSVVAVSSVTAARCPLDDTARDWLLGLSDREMKAELTSLAGKSAYETSKSLINRWILHQAASHAARSIRFNSVSPGPVETPILDDFRRSIGADRIAAAEALTGRHGRPEEIAEVVAFLLSPRASWINGSDVRADGGYHALRALTGGN
jgi:NAD(P)-dependent dehydrogenase (short-subunit alcohol dehydrogenase family)